MEITTIEIVLLSIYVLLIAWGNAYFDSSQIKLKWGKVISLNHTTRAILRGILFIASTLVVVKSLTGIVLVLIYQSLLFWIAFDFMLNLYLKRDLFSLGITSKIDIFLTKYSPTLLKLLLLIISIYFLSNNVFYFYRRY